MYRFRTPMLAGNLFLVLLLFGAAFRGEAQQNELILEAADNSSPRTTLEGFLEGCNLAYDRFFKKPHGEKRATKMQEDRLVDELLRNLDLSEEPDYSRETTGKEAAACIKEILDRIELPSMDEVPGPEDLAADTESGLVDRWQIPGTALVIHRVTEGARAGDYLFSPETVNKAIRNYDLVKGLPYKEGATPDFYAWYLTHPGDTIAPLVNALPDGFRTRMIGRQALWQWIALGILVIVSFASMIGLYFVGRKLAAKRLKVSMIWYGLTLGYPILAMLVPMVFNHLLEEEIRIAGKLLSGLTFAANVVFLLAAMIVINGLGTRIAEFIISNPKIPNKGLDAQFIRLIAKVLSLVLAVIVFLEGGKYLGIPISTLLASAGIGGFAFALAAQDSLKNFFGSIMIYLDKPYRIGERIAVKGYDGIVEEIGIRSTRLRLLTGHQATIPNEEMARSDIENIGRRPHIRRLVDLKLPIDTPPEKAEKAVEIVREILEDHEGMEADFPPRVFYTDIHPDSLNLRFVYWYHPPEYWDFLEFSQGVNLQIQRKFDKAGIALEVPTRLLQIGDSESSVGGGNDSPSEPET